MKRQALSNVFAQLILIFCVIGLSQAEPLKLGSVTFPTSGPEAAQEHFLRGVKYLHSFGFEDAAEAFQAASTVAPDFAMAYWGEALSHNHPLLPERDLESPRQVLARLGPTPAERATKAPTAREAGFLAAVEILYGEGARPSVRSPTHRRWADWPPNIQMRKRSRLLCRGAAWHGPPYRRLMGRRINLSRPDASRCNCPRHLSQTP